MSDLANSWRPYGADAVHATGASSCTLPTSTSLPDSAQASGKRPAELQQRKDTPVTNYAIRGDKKLGMQVAGNPDLLDEALGTYRTEVRSSGDTSDAYIKTWSYFHGKVNWARLGEPEPSPVGPLTPKKVEVIGAILKISHYRSTKNYITAMKRHHRLQGYEWSDQLELAHSAFVQSTLRGIGPGKQSSPLPFAKLADVDLNAELVHDDFPVLPGCACVLFTYFLLRELECATAEFGDMTLDVGQEYGTDASVCIQE